MKKVIVVSSESHRYASVDANTDLSMHLVRISFSEQLFMDSCCFGQKFVWLSLDLSLIFETIFDNNLFLDVDKFKMFKKPAALVVI